MSVIDFKINEKFKEFLFCDKPYALLFGGSGSGKSFAVTQKIILRTMNEDGNRTLVLMKTGSRLRTFAYQTFVDVINMYGLNEFFELRYSPLEIICKTNGNKIIFSGLDEPENLKSIPGIMNIFIEEATNISRQDFEQVNLRLRGQYKYYQQIVLACNPVDKSSWIYQDFIQDVKYAPAGIFKSTFRDNPYIGDDYEYRIRQSFKNNENLLGVYLDGEWGSIDTQKIYTNWRVDGSISQDFNDYKYKYAGIDFGWNDPNVCLGVGFDEDKVYVFREFYKSGITIKQFAGEIKQMVPRHILCIADARSPGLIQELKNNGIYVRHSDKTPNSIAAGINFLKGYEIIIHPDCKNTIEEIQGYSYLYDELNNSWFDKPTQGNDHCLDCLRYSADAVRLRKTVTAGIKIF